VVETTSEGVETHVKISEILGRDIPNFAETLGGDNPKLPDNLGKNLNSGSNTVLHIIDDSTKGSGDCVVETLKETVPETSVVQSVGTSVAPATATNI
ncbi:hypothetical protein A2U01_0071292, partial [Trifolium medium]|nr:hypothetical protein [Trifolium medium]